MQYAAAKVGAILVNINPAYRLRELEYALNQSGVSILVTARRFRKTDYVEMLTTLMPELTMPRTGLAPDRERPEPEAPDLSGQRGRARRDLMGRLSFSTPTARPRRI